ncbi:MAG: hypothetical protein U0768_08985 [Anaerolineae bacterium]
MQQPPSLPLDYRPELFVNREQARDRVVAKVSELRQGRQIDRRTLVFRGPHGVGKTWLLQHLADAAIQPPDAPHHVLGEYLAQGSPPSATSLFVHALYVDLRLFHNLALDDAIRQIVVGIQQQCAGWSKLPTPSHANMSSRSDEWSTLLLQTLDTLLATHVLLVLLDHVFECPSAFYYELEDRLLAPLAVQPRVVIVMAGRGQAPRSIAPELRFYVDDDNLPSFTPTATAQQLEQLANHNYVVTQSPAAVQAASLGYPLGNLLLAGGGSMASVASELLHGVPLDIRQDIEAVCILRSFEEDRLGCMMNAYAAQASLSNDPPPDPARRLRLLIDTKLVGWNNERGGYVVDEAVRPVLESYLKTDQPVLWQQLHCAAHHLYADWVNRFPRRAALWRAELEYHAACLTQVGINPETCQPPAN